MKYQRGIILIIVLLFLMILSMLGASAMETSILQIRMSHHFHQEINHFELAETALLKIEEKIAYQKMPDCYHEKPILESLKNKNERWWEDNACKENGFFYFIEQVEIDDCAQLADNSLPGVVYYRITCKVIDLNNPDDETILQTTYAMPITTQTICVNIRTVNSGRQSWRQI